MSYLEELDARLRSADPEYDRIRAVDSFIAELIKARRNRGLTQAQVAEAAGIRQSHVSKIESFESDRVAFRTILRYAAALGLSLVLVEDRNVAKEFRYKRKTPAEKLAVAERRASR